MQHQALLNAAAALPDELAQLITAPLDPVDISQLLLASKHLSRRLGFPAAAASSRPRVTADVHSDRAWQDELASALARARVTRDARAKGCALTVHLDFSWTQQLGSDRVLRMLHRKAWQTQLRELRVQGVGGITFDGVQGLLQQFPALERLELLQCRWQGSGEDADDEEDARRSLVLQHARLRRLVVGCGSWSKRPRFCVAGLPALATLWVPDCFFFSRASDPPPHVRDVRLTVGSYMSDWHMDRLARSVGDRVGVLQVDHGDVLYVCELAQTCRLALPALHTLLLPTRSLDCDRLRALLEGLPSLRRVRLRRVRFHKYRADGAGVTLAPARMLQLWVDEAQDPDLARGWEGVRVRVDSALHFCFAEEGDRWYGRDNEALPSARLCLELQPGFELRATCSTYNPRPSYVRSHIAPLVSQQQPQCSALTLGTREFSITCEHSTPGPAPAVALRTNHASALALLPGAGHACTVKVTEGCEASAGFRQRASEVLPRATLVESTESQLQPQAAR